MPVYVQNQEQDDDLGERNVIIGLLYKNSSNFCYCNNNNVNNKTLNNVKTKLSLTK